jgi:hypothetical protein
VFVGLVGSEFPGRDENGPYLDSLQLRQFLVLVKDREKSKEKSGGLCLASNEFAQLEHLNVVRVTRD